MNEIGTYTLAEITSLLCPDCDEREAYRVSRKIQNQVSSKLILPLKSHHKGRGVHRLYDRYEVYKARTLLELGQFQTPADVLELVASVLYCLDISNMSFSVVTTVRNYSAPKTIPISI